MSLNSFEIIEADDGHHHLREGAVLKEVVPEVARLFKRVLVMGNKPLIDTPERIISYKQEINFVSGDGLEPIMSLFMTDNTTPEMVLEAARVGACAIKTMPKSRFADMQEASTGAANGVTPPCFAQKDDLFAAAAEASINQCCHGEDPDLPHATREREFLPFLHSIVHRHPRTRFILEHITDRASITFIKEHKNVYGSITLHHLLLTWSDVVGNNDHFCAPVAKTEDDRMALLEVAMSGHPRFFFGSDSAPHPRRLKNQAMAACGIYTASVALELLVQIFVENGKQGLLEDFVSRYFAEAYRLPQNTGRVEFVREPWTVPDPVAERPNDSSVIRPFWAGRRVEFRARRIA